MIRQSTQGYTGSLNNQSLSVQEEDSAMKITLLVVSGTCKVTGNKPFKGLDPSPVILPTGGSLTLSGENAPLAGWTFEAVGGETLMVVSFV